MKSKLRILRLSNILAVCLIVALLSLSVPAKTVQAATRWVLTKTILSPTPSGGGFFGMALAVAGNNFVIGSRDCDEVLQVCGAAHMFDSNGNVIRSIFVPTGETFSGFGEAVGAVGSNPLVGAYLDDTAGEDAGAAYLFDGATGNLLQTFLNPNPAIGAPFSLDFFGRDVAGFGDDVLVGASGEDLGAEDAGAVYLFDGATGQLLVTIQDPTPDIQESFGAAITSFGNKIAITAPFDDTASENGGAVHIYDANGNFLRTLVSPRPVEFSQFGNALAAFGDDLLVSETRGFTGDVRAGVVHLFDGDTGELIRSYFNPTPEPFELFGNSIAASGNNVLIGALLNVKSRHAGAAYLFDGTTAQLTATLINPQRGVTDSFANQVAVIGDNLLVSSPFESSDPANIADDGVVYLFQPK